MPDVPTTTDTGSGFLGRLDRWLGRALLDPEDAHALGLCRALVAGVLTLSLLSHVGSVGEYFSDESVVAGQFAREAFPSRWSVFFWLGDPAVVRAVFGVGLVAHILWVVGLFTVPAGIVSFGLWASLVGRNPLLYSLPDQLQMALALLLALLPAGRGFSLDAAWRGRGGTVPVWCRRLVQLQLGVLYVGTGFLKWGGTWKTGTALYFALVNPYNRHFEVSSLLAQLQPWLLRPMTWAVLVWEVAFGGFVLLHWIREARGRPRRIPDLRPAFLGFGIAMHLGIQALLYVVWFSALCIGAYSAFLDSHESRAAVAWVRGRIARRGRRIEGRSGIEAS